MIRMGIEDGRGRREGGEEKIGMKEMRKVIWIILESYMDYIEDYIGLKEGKTVGEDETQNKVWKFGEKIEK